MPETRRLRAFCWLAGAVTLLTLLGMPAHASENAAGQSITRTALDAVGTYQGDCWPWVRRVVQEATGRTIGFDYRQGFLDAGAFEVAVADAEAGDVIQIANDRNTGSGADYPGLHTAIVLQNHGSGIFTVVDSNSNWDGMVRIRAGYDPNAMAARYSGLTARAYRFSGDSPVAGIKRTTPTEAPHPVATGDTARVSAGGDCLNLRTTAGTLGTVITCLADGTSLRIRSEPVRSGGLDWVQVTAAGGQTGWVASIYIQFIAPGASTPATTGGPLAPLMPYRSVVPNLTGNPQ